MRAEPVRHAGARAVGDGHRTPPGRSLRHAGRVDVGRRRHRAAAARGGRRHAARRDRDRPRGHRGAGGVDAAPDGAVLGPVPRVCRPVAAPAPAPARSAHAAVAAAPAGRRPARRRRQASDVPVLLEASRECLQDVFDVPALREVLGQLRSRAVRVVSVETSKPSPMAQSLLFNWIAAYMYEGDAPLAERRAAALALDRDLLADLLGAEELRELLDPDVLADVELDLQRLSDGRRARSADELHDVLRRVGDLTRRRDRAALRAGRGHVGSGAAGRRSSPSGERSRSGSPASSASSRPRTRPATATRSDARCRWGSPRCSPTRFPARWRTSSAATPGPTDRSSSATSRSASGCPSRGCSGRLARWRPTAASCAASSAPTACAASGATSKCCASSAAGRWRCCARRSSRSSSRCSPSSCRRGRGWGARGRGSSRWSRRSGSLPARRSWRRRSSATSCAARVSEYRPPLLDELCTSGEVVWVGAGAIGSNDGRVRLCFVDQLALLAPGVGRGRSARRVRCTTRSATCSARGGASFWSQLRAGVVGPTDDELLAALWDLVWAGEVTNDSMAALRAMTTGVGPAARRSAVAGRSAVPAAGRAGSGASARPPAPGGGVSSPHCSSRADAPQHRLTPRRCSSSSGRGW